MNVTTLIVTITTCLLKYQVLPTNTVILVLYSNLIAIKNYFTNNKIQLKNCDTSIYDVINHYIYLST